MNEFKKLLFTYSRIKKYKLGSKHQNGWFQNSCRSISIFNNHLSDVNNPNFSNEKGSAYILGIETSCDDTGAAILNERGQILGEGLYSQVEKTVKYGGVLPSIASKYHEDNINKAVNEAFEISKITPDKLTAVAVTVKPGNRRTLKIGCEHGKTLALKHKLPFIPIHHMEAHALTVRMDSRVDFPFVVLLVSGGHCILSIAHSVDEWSIIGEGTDSAPGVALDQVARRMKLRNLPGMGKVIGGRAIEILAKDGNPMKYEFPVSMSKHGDSNFSFSGLESFAKDLLITLEKEKGIEGGRVLDKECLSDLCASFQYGLVSHMIRKTHRGLRFAEHTQRIPSENKTLVISGGVASNQFLRQSFEILCKEEDYRLLIPPPKLCTDNGVMIAWNGIERWRAGKGILYDEDEIKSVTVEHKCPLGPNLSAEHRSLFITPKRIKIL